MSEAKQEVRAEESGDDSRTVHLVSGEGESFDVPLSVAKMSELVKTMIADEQDDDEPEKKEHRHQHDHNKGFFTRAEDDSDDLEVYLTRFFVVCASEMNYCRKKVLRMMVWFIRYANRLFVCFFFV